MRRLVIGDFIGFQPANDAPDGVPTIEFSTEGDPSPADNVERLLSEGLVRVDLSQIKMGDKAYPKAMAEYNATASKNAYLADKNARPAGGQTAAKPSSKKSK